MKSNAFLLPLIRRFYLEAPLFLRNGARKMSETLQQMIENYERDIKGNTYSLYLADGEIITFEIKPKNVPHLMGIGKLPLRQVRGKYAGELYNMMRSGALTLRNITSVPNHKEIYKKVMNFHYLIDILHCGDGVRVVKKLGRLKSQYLLYLDHRPDEIIHLGLAKDTVGNWYPESLLVLQRDVTAYIRNQQPVAILRMVVN